ncbi:MAG TPA: hypothetical protein VLC46_03660 [Thermoanaerobaculia bacterium]|nr:hypothetical protein [Thermoanaerobaculia bacterium]
MTFINWSDSHEMLGLLVEYIVDERHEANDPARAAFLAGVLEELEELTAQVDEMTDDESIAALRMIQDSVNDEFRGDTVLQHIQDCIEELERIRNRVMA